MHPVAETPGRLLSVGEAMLLVASAPHRRLAAGSVAELDIAGAEATVAVAARRLGAVSEWIGGLGKDLPGDLILAGLRAHNVEVARAPRRADAPTGVLFRDVGVSNPRVAYLRRGSAASHLTSEDVPDEALAAADHLHITGITPALSETCARLAADLVVRAHRHGTSVSLDVNYRHALLTPERARSLLTPLAAEVDVLFAGQDELALVWGEAEREDVASQLGRLRQLGRDEVVLKRGAEGATGWSHASGRIDMPTPLTTPVDPVGAGDAFVAGYLAARLAGRSAAERLRQGTIVAASAVTGAGDLAGLPDAAVLAAAERLGMDVVR